MRFAVGDGAVRQWRTALTASYTRREARAGRPREGSYGCRLR